MNDHNRLMKLKKEQLVALAADVLEHVDLFTANYMYATEATKDIRQVFAHHGVPIDQEVTYQVNLKVRYNRNADIPEIREVEGALTQAIERWIGDENPCVFNDDNEPNEDFELFISKAVG